MKRKLLRIIALICCIVFICGWAHAQSPTEFTYQGKLLDTGTPSANYDFQFWLWDSLTLGNALAGATRNNVPVVNGVFSVRIDFGDMFPGAPRYLEIRVRNAGGTTHQILGPRQLLTAAPYAMNANLLGGRQPTSFIYNTTSPQAANFAIQGSGLMFGNLNLGVEDVQFTYRLDVNGRARYKQAGIDTGGTNSAGFWLFQNAPNVERAFIGMQDDNNVGFYGNNGAAWGLTMNTTTGNVGIGTAPNDKLEVNGFMRVNQLSGGGTTQLCRNGANQLSLCGSSLRFKTNIAPFFSGLSFIRQLRPITFIWIEGGMRDVGFGAEDVAKIDPLFVTYNDKGQIEGVKYDRISVVAVNAIKEQQAEIDTLRNENRQQQKRVEALTDLVCSLRPRAAIC